MCNVAETCHAGSVRVRVRLTGRGAVTARAVAVRAVASQWSFLARRQRHAPLPNLQALPVAVAKGQRRYNKQALPAVSSALMVYSTTVCVGCSCALWGLILHMLGC
eukprot:353231-Chlamydomonas_euryale.AAC.2